MPRNKNAFRLIGGRTCLDFVNTADWSKRGELLNDKLGSDADIAAWCRTAGLGGVRLDGSPLVKVRAFRGALRGLLQDAIAGTASGGDNLARLNATLRSMETPVLEVTPGGFAFAAGTTLEQAVAVSAAALLGRSGDRDRLKICPGGDCGWMFLDESRNRRRTWCAMDMCGNRAKARRHYRRKTGGA